MMTSAIIAAEGVPFFYFVFFLSQHFERSKYLRSLICLFICTVSPIKPGCTKYEKDA